MKEYQKKIDKIGQKLVNCKYDCRGVEKDLANGIFPRCLILEHTGRDRNGKGIVIIGVNPGIASARERSFCREHGPNHKTNLDYWERYIGNNHSYNIRLKMVAEQVGFTGPILWTEIVKCQKIKNVKFSSINYPDTFRKCAHKFLLHELQSIPRNWPLLTGGQEAFRALLYLDLGRPLIGVPHPTGAYALFWGLFSNHNLRPKIIGAIKNTLRDNQAIWLGNAIVKI